MNQVQTLEEEAANPPLMIAKEDQSMWVTATFYQAYNINLVVYNALVANL